MKWILSLFLGVLTRSILKPWKSFWFHTMRHKSFTTLVLKHIMHFHILLKYIYHMQVSLGPCCWRHYRQVMLFSLFSDDRATWINQAVSIFWLLILKSIDMQNYNLIVMNILYCVEPKRFIEVVEHCPSQCLNFYLPWNLSK